MDIAMPGMDGLAATRQIKARWPHVNVLVLTIHRQDEYFFETLRAGASGYVLKAAETSDLINAIRIVSRGEVFLYPAMAQRLVRDYLCRTAEGIESGPELSPREKEILQLLAEGYSNQEIAEKLVISPSTVHTHRSNVMSKLGLSTRHELVEYARQRGLVRDF
jgi:two-component system response regulator NreC